MADSAAILKIPSSAALARHMIFVCPECGVTSDTQQEWRKHLNEVHGYGSKTPESLDFIEIDRKYHECQVCLQRIANAHQSPVILQYHRFSHMRYSPFRCRHCPSSYAKKRTLCVHIFRFHRRLINSLDRQRMDPKYNREFFIRFVCPQCGKIFDQSGEWEKHIDNAHLSTSVNLGMHRIEGSNNYYCDQCSHIIKNSPTKNQLRKHHFSHLPRPEYFLCAFCPIRVSHKTQLFSHFMTTHKDEYYKNDKYICRPVEWGVATPTEMGITKGKSTDILQKALLKSSIDLQEEDQCDVQHDYNEYGKKQKTDNDKKFKKIKDMEEEEFEQICKEMFEEITEEQWHSLRKNKGQDIEETSNLTEKLRVEMQKYINYLCPICLREFASQPAWRSHVFDQHNLATDVKSKFRALNLNKTAYVCLVCHQIQRTSKQTELQRHHFLHMPHQGYLKCTICMDTKSSKSKMFQHMKYIHRIQVEVEDEDDYEDNDVLQSQIVAKGLRCLECDEVFEHALQLQNHYKTCPSRLVPIAVGQYDMAKNMRLLDHLQKTSRRFDCMLIEQRIDVNSIKLAYK